MKRISAYIIIGFMPIILALRKLRQEDLHVEVSLNYIVEFKANQG